MTSATKRHVLKALAERVDYLATLEAEYAADSDHGMAAIYRKGKRECLAAIEEVEDL